MGSICTRAFGSVKLMSIPVSSVERKSITLPVAVAMKSACTYPVRSLATLLASVVPPLSLKILAMAAFFLLMLAWLNLQHM